MCQFGFWLASRQSWLGCLGVCVCVRAPPVPHHSCLPSAVWVCLLGFGFGLRPAVPRLAFLGVRASVRTPPLSRLSWFGFIVCVFGSRQSLLRCWRVCGCVRVPPVPRRSRQGCGVWLCAWVRASAAPRHSWLGCWSVCVGVRAPPLPRHSWLVVVVCGPAVAWHLLLCRGLSCIVCPFRVCGTWWLLLLGTSPCALVAAGSVPLWRASWPQVLHHASSCPVALGALVSFPVAVVPSPTRCFRPRNYLAAARGMSRAAENLAHGACCWPLLRQGS